MAALGIKNKKIAILTPTYSEFSGIDRVVEQQAMELSKDNEVAIFTLKADMQSNFPIVEIGMPKSPFFERMYRLFFFLFKKGRYIKKLGEFDVVVSHFYPMNYLAYKAKNKYGNKIKYIYYNHGVVFINLFPGFFERVYLKLFKAFNHWTIKNCDRAVSVSKFLASELKKDTGIKSEVIYNPIDKKYCLGIDGNYVRDKYHISKNEKMLLYVGRISPHKGVDILIEIFNKVVEKMPNTKLVIVGKHTFGNYSKKLQRLSEKNKDKTIFAGFVPDDELENYYAACDLYVTASLWEGFDLPIVEAQHCGKRAVAFDLCSHPEVVKNGILVKPNDLEGFKDAIVKILADKR